MWPKTCSRVIVCELLKLLHLVPFVLKSTTYCAHLFDSGDPDGQSLVLDATPFTPFKRIILFLFNDFSHRVSCHF
jgi:hypothetical protein